MAKRSLEKLSAELEAVEALIARHPTGIGRPALEAAFAETYGSTMPMHTCCGG